MEKAPFINNVLNLKGDHLPGRTLPWHRPAYQDVDNQGLNSPCVQQFDVSSRPYSTTNTNDTSSAPALSLVNSQSRKSLIPLLPLRMTSTLLHVSQERLLWKAALGHCGCKASMKWSSTYG
jgi:hypothetical protein